MKSQVKKFSNVTELHDGEVQNLPMEACSDLNVELNSDDDDYNNEHSCFIILTHCTW